MAGQCGCRSGTCTVPSTSFPAVVDCTRRGTGTYPAHRIPATGPGGMCSSRRSVEPGPRTVLARPGTDARLADDRACSSEVRYLQQHLPRWRCCTYRAGCISYTSWRRRSCSLPRNFAVLMRCTTFAWPRRTAAPRETVRPDVARPSVGWSGEGRWGSPDVVVVVQDDAAAAGGAGRMGGWRMDGRCGRWCCTG